MSVRPLIFNTAWGAVALAAVSQAQAQTPPGVPPAQPPTQAQPLGPPQPATQPDEAEAVVDTIIVTADRRSQNLQEAPAAINVVTGETMDTLRIDSAANLSNFVPGLKMDGNGRDQLRLGLRGAFASSNSPGTGQAVGLYIDGIYYAHTSDLGHNLFDIRQVEVLRGPQGTLYGQNVVGGLINIITEAPSEIFRFDASASYSSFDRIDLNARVSGPLAETLAGSLAVYRTTSEGWQRNLVTGNRLDQLDTFGARGRLEWNPTPELRVGLIADYSMDQTYGIPRNVVFGDPIRFTVPDWKETRLARDGGYDSEAVHAALLVDYDLGWATASSITSIQRNRPLAIEQNFVTDPVSNQANTRSNNTDTFTQEFRLAGVAGRLRWQGGAFFFSDEAEQTLFYDVFAAPGTQAGGATGLSGTNLSVFKVETESRSVFAQATYAFTDVLSLTLGGRQTWDEKNGVYDNRGPSTNIGLLTGPPFIVRNEAEWEEFTPRATLDADFRDIGPIEKLLLFATVSKGYQSGDFVAGATAAAASAIVPPQTADNVEFGFKSTFLNGGLTLNTTVFSVDYNDLQTLSITGAGLIQVASTDATAEGLEIAATWRPIEGLLLQADYAYLDTEIAAGARAPDNSMVGGNQLPQSPRHSYNFLASYEREIALDTDLRFTAAYTEKTSVFFDVRNARTAQPEVLDLTRVQNLDADITLRRGRYEFSIWGKNLLDDKSTQRVYDGSRGFVLTGAERAAGENYLDGVFVTPLQIGATLRFSY